MSIYKLKLSTHPKSHWYAAMNYNNDGRTSIEMFNAGPGDYPLEQDALVMATLANRSIALIEVAKAAKCYTNADQMVRGEAYRDLCEALSRLEAMR